MSYRRLSVDDCTDGLTCPSVWLDDADPDHVVIVGKVTDPGTVPVGTGEVAVRLSRQVILNAELG